MSLVTDSEFSVMPFWFWNDELWADEIVRQIADFEAHGVHGFVIHPRVGLPRHLGWMSDGLLSFMSVAIDEAERRGMKVILYDEGMYPSGSACGQLVARNPDFACRCIAMKQHDRGSSPDLGADENLIATFETPDGRAMTVFDRKADAYIRGLHYIGEGPAEDEPPMGDILNPDAVSLLIHIVHDQFAARFSRHFGKTVIGVFTDEPNPLGKSREKAAWPGTRGILAHINRLLGYDFTPHLPALWLDDAPDARKHRHNYRWAIRRRMEETWYQPLHDWCEKHGVALCGHPADGDEIAAHRFFHFPGQDLVWRWVEPLKPTALEGPESTQAKNSSSAMIHRNRRRNSNEFCGAYGPETTFEEFTWLANWCLVRGVNLLIPHAFYHSVRGERKNERPPQVGPNSPWWNKFKAFAEHCQMLCWANTDSKHQCDVAILTGPDHCPWKAAKVCFENQIDFNYLEHALLLESATVNEGGIDIAGMHYAVLVIDGPEIPPSAVLEKLEPMIRAGRVMAFGFEQPLRGIPLELEREGLTEAIRLHSELVLSSLIEVGSADLRVRQVTKEGRSYAILFNEGKEMLPVQLANEVAVLVASEFLSGVAIRSNLCKKLILSPFEATFVEIITSP